MYNHLSYTSRALYVDNFEHGNEWCVVTCPHSLNILGSASYDHDFVSICETKISVWCTLGP